MRIRGDHRLYALAVSIASIELASCGAGVAAVAASAGGSGGGGNAPPALTAFEVLGPKVSPATLRLVVSDPEGDPVQAELFFAAGANPEAPLSALEGVTGNQVVLPSSGAGTETLLDWDFEAELGGRGFVPALDLVVRQRGGAAISGGAIRVGIGNDPPVVASVVPVPSDPQDPGQSSGIVELRLVVADSSSDTVTLAFEWRRASDPPDAWHPATAAGIFPAGVETDADGVELSFFWNTNVDLREGDEEVILRATPDDRTPRALGVGEPKESGPFQIDNNDEPILQLLTETFVPGTDERRGIPIPFRVTDEEGDVVEVVFQWQRQLEPFPELPTGRAELDAILVDPVLRRQRHICTAYPRYARGRVVPVDENTVRLPELAQAESWALAWELEGRTLELLRRSSLPEAISMRWPVNPLVAPVAALPLGDGLTAVVVDGVGAPRVREIELATGRVVRVIATLDVGTPTAAALERGSAAVLVASELGGAWHVERVELASGAVTLLLSDGASPPAPVRGIASLGRKAALVTVGSKLATIDYRDPLAARFATLLDGLATPWGVVLDPLQEGRVYVAERDAPRDDGGAGRILAVDLDSHASVPVAVKQGPVVLEHPEALALDSNGVRMLVLQGQVGARQLVGLDLGGRSGNEPFMVVPLMVPEAASVASGADGLIVVTLTGNSHLIVGGGVEQRRSIVAPVFPPTLHASVDAPFAPLPSPDQPWRIALAPRLRAGPQGADRSFAWDASVDVPSGGSVVLRGLVRDSEAGIVVEGRVPKSIRVPLQVDPITVGTGQINDVTASDLDGDGDLDLAVAGSQASSLSVRFQTAPAVFGGSIFLRNAATTLNPTSIESADLDCDGDVDLASSNGRQRGGTLDVYFQVAPGSYGPVPLVLASPDMLFPDCVRAADLDQDGDLDLASANRLSQNLTVYEQIAPGTFASDLTVLDLPTTGEQCVAVADLDGDGDVDLAAASALFFQSAPGVFDLPIEIAGSLPLAAADLDKDGDIDLITGNKLFFQNVPGEFTPKVELPLRGSVQAADIDADGDCDLVTGAGIFFQMSSGMFDPDPLLVGGSAAADLDGDADLDVISWPNALMQASPGDFDADPLSIDTPGRLTAVADLDADGDQDLVTTSGVHFQSVPRVFQSDPVTIIGAPSFFFVHAADLDGDGDIDLASANFFSLRIHFQLRPGSFDLEPQLLGLAEGFPVFVTSADLDGDDDLDLATTDTDGLTVFFQSSPGGFDPLPLVLDVPEQPPFLSDGNPRWIAAADFDLDGDLDLASANGRSSNGRPDTALSIFFQNAPGSFDPVPLGLEVPAGGSNSITAADLDGDGDIDLASANERVNNRGNTTLFFQTARGSFDPTPLLLFAGPPNSLIEPRYVASADLDDDGDGDLITSNSVGLFEGDMTAYFQTALGAFDPTTLRFATGGGATPVLPGDIDGDGDVDLATGGLLPSSIFIFWGGR